MLGRDVEQRDRLFDELGECTEFCTTTEIFEILLCVRVEVETEASAATGGRRFFFCRPAGRYCDR